MVELENKLMEVEKILLNAESLVEIKSVKTIAKISEKKLPIFVTGRLPFTLQNNRNITVDFDVIQEVVSSQTIGLELDQSGLSEDYTLWHHIYMGGSLSKFVDAKNSDNGKYDMGRNSHLAVYLRGMMRNSQNLGLLGQVHKTGENLYIKPYSIWA